MTPDEHNDAENYARRINGIVAMRDSKENFAIPSGKLSLICRAVFEKVEKPVQQSPLTPQQQKVITLLATGPQRIAFIHEALEYQKIMITKNVLGKLQEMGRINVVGEMVTLIPLVSE